MDSIVHRIEFIKQKYVTVWCGFNKSEESTVEWIFDEFAEEWDSKWIPTDDFLDLYLTRQEFMLKQATENLEKVNVVRNELKRKRENLE